MAISYSEAGPSLHTENFVLAARTTANENVETECFQFARSALMPVKRVISLEVFEGELHKKVGFLVVPSLKTIVIFDTAFIEKYVENISSMVSFIALVNASPVAVVSAMCQDYVLTFESYNGQRKPDWAAAEQKCVLTQAMSLAPMSKSIEGVHTSAEGIQLVGTHKHPFQKWKALVEQDIVETVSGVSCNVKVDTFATSCMTLTKSTKFALCLKVSWVWFVLGSVKIVSTPLTPYKSIKTSSRIERFGMTPRSKTTEQYDRKKALAWKRLILKKIIKPHVFNLGDNKEVKADARRAFQTNCRRKAPNCYKSPPFTAIFSVS